MPANTFDAIVIGSGISGGWAAKELCEKGLKTLVLERGKDVEHIKGYPTASKDPWQFDHRLSVTQQMKQENPILQKCYAYSEATEQFFVKDHEHPYKQEKPFDWIRGYQVGGKSLLWARQTQRWSDLDFEANAKEGIGADWPIRYKDIAPWYSYVERFAGINGNKDGIPHLPDGEFLPPMELNCVEQMVQQKMKAHFTDRQLIVGRSANLTQAQQIHTRIGRQNCQYRNLCSRGCPFGGYFSSNSATLPAARITGNLTLRPLSVVHSIIYDEQKQRATGVRVIDAVTKQATEYFASIIFVNASTINSTLILLNSVSARFPNGLGNDSGVLGHYLMDHNYRVRVGGEVEGFDDQYYYGRRANGIYIPRFRNVGVDKQTAFLRGYSFAGGATRDRGRGSEGIGAHLKEQLTEPGKWRFNMHAMGEMLPDVNNKVTLHPSEKDAWDMPQVVIDCEYKANELHMCKDIMATGQEIMEAAGIKVTSVTNNDQWFPGLSIHEMGTCRMGRDPKTSMLNQWNQLHAVKNVFVTDGSSMASSACQNPSLTYMALTARACDYAVSELKKQNI
jgi:choline dehydrogenase-like flavoprotein